MRVFAAVAVLAMSAVVLVGGGPARAAAPDPNAYVASTAYVPSFDGTLLHASIFRPADAPHTRTPVILEFNPYTNTGGSIAAGAGLGVLPTPFNKAPVGPGGPAGMFADGYSKVIIDDRGTGGSGGCFDIWGPASIKDTAAMIAWAAGQPWSDGKVVTYGQSAGGWSQLDALSTHPAALVAAAIGYATVGSGEVWTNGVLNTVGALWGPAWALNDLYPPSIYSPAPYILNALSRDLTDPLCGAVQMLGSLTRPGSAYWQPRDAIVPAAETSTTPVLWVGSFADFNAREAEYISMFNHLDAPHAGLFGQWNHASGDFDAEALAWYDHWVKGTPFTQPPVLVQGIDGSWRAETAWPPPDAAPYSMRLVPGWYTDSPDNMSETQPPPALALGQPSLETGQGTWTISQPLTSQVRIAGHVTVSASVDTTLPVSMVALVYDIAPDGHASFVARGAEQVTRSGTASFPMDPEDWAFAAGDRIGLLLSGSDLYWFVPSSTFTTVKITGGTMTLPVLRCARTVTLTSGTPDYTPRSVPPPFTVSAATISSSTSVSPPPPAPSTC